MCLKMSRYSEDALLPISGLQHLAYCPRQFSLIHIEQLWEENRYTAEGQLLHQRVDQEHRESRGSTHIAHALRLRSLKYGLTGIADVVEFHRVNNGVALAGKRGKWMPYPVEYKRGRPKKDNIDAVQLCAQALCLEEMLSIEIPAGALFYGKTRRRKEILFTDALRSETLLLTREMHQLLESQATVVAEKGKKCGQCSLQSPCMPKERQWVDTKTYIKQLFSDAELIE
jgi:CRISPR-associated exonuclease Cas4